MCKVRPKEKGGGREEGGREGGGREGGRERKREEGGGGAREEGGRREGGREEGGRGEGGRVGLFSSACITSTSDAVKGAYKEKRSYVVQEGHICGEGCQEDTCALCPLQ